MLMMHMHMAWWLLLLHQKKASYSVTFWANGQWIIQELGRALKVIIHHVDRHTQHNLYIMTIGESYARCTFCSDFSVAHGGKNDVVVHINTKRHKEAGKAVAATKSVSSFFRRDISSSTINAESLWTMFIAKHNLAFLCSDHGNKLFRASYSGRCSLIQR